MRAELDGGSLMDVGCYCVSAARLLAGEPEVVTGEWVRRGSGVDVRFAGTMRLPGGVIAHFDCGFDVPYRAAIEAVGAEGSLALADPWHARSPGMTLSRGDEVERIEIEPANSYQLQLENFADAIRGEAVPLLGHEDALGQARALEALYRAAEERRAVEPSA